jgi:RNA recognition motif-containing protein
MGPRTQVFVANIAWKSTEDDIRRLFEDEGEQIDNVRIMTADDGRSRGFGFVTFANDRVNVPQVIAKMNGKELGGRQLVVEHAKGIAKRN